MANPPTTPNDLVLTNGWDTVYAIRFSAVNKAIVAQKSSPANFTQSTTDPLMGTVSVKGNFSDWQLTLGGGDQNVFMSIPIPTSELTTSQHDLKYTSPITAKILLNLNFLNDQGQPDSGDTSKHKSYLKVNTKPNPGAGMDKAVSVINIDPGSNPMGIEETGLFSGLLEAWLNANIGDFNHVFGILDMNEVADQDKSGFQWLLPTEKQYAVVDVDGNLDNSVFAMMCMTGNRPAPDGAHQVSPFAIPDGANSGFLIAPERLVSEMLYPGIPYMFLNSSVGDFNITNANLSITNVNAVQFAQQTTDDGKTIQPSLAPNGFVLTVENTTVKMEILNLTYEWSPGISVKITHTSSSSLSMTTDRKFKMDFISGTNAGSVESAEWVDMVTLLANIVGAVLGAAVGGLFAPAEEAGTTAVESGLEGSFDSLTVTAEASGPSDLTNMTDEELDEAIGDMETGDPVGEAKQWFKSFFARNWCKMLGAMFGAAIANIPLYLKLWANDHKYVPTLDEFGTEAMSPVTWPNLSNQGITLVNGRLYGAFQMGINVNFNS